MKKRIAIALALAAVVLGIGRTVTAVEVAEPAAGRAQVVVALEAQPLALAPSNAARIDREQRAFRSALSRRLPDARVRWRYRLVQNGFAVDLPRSQVSRLRGLPGIREVFPSPTYAPQLDNSPRQIGAPAIWGAGLETAGEGVKIGIIDSGVDARHPFFDPTRFSMPAGFPKGQTRFTTAKVIVARAFPPRGAPASGRVAFSSDDSSHGTHVAGIAAGNANTRAIGGRVVSGVAPKAYIGSYKVFVPTISGISPNAGAAEIVAAIESAVADGMDVINFSGGEAEVEPSRDVVARAFDAAAAAGVVPVVAAGNSFDNEGAGSVTSPGSAAGAVTVGAVQILADSTPVHAEFSSVGPTPISLRQKPDVVAPGVSILSSVPGGWSAISGTSMAAPHVAGAAALLRQRHREWSVSQVKAALVETGAGTRLEEGSGSLAVPPYVGGGLVSLASADRPLVFAEPSALSFGLQLSGTRAGQAVELTDAGGGAGSWEVSVEGWRGPTGAQVVVPPTVEVPGRLQVELAAGDARGVVTGFISLRRGADVRHLPFWGRVAAPRLAGQTALALPSTGFYRGTTRGRPSLVTRYRYPEDPSGIGVRIQLRGPELVYRVRLTQRVANFGVVVTGRSRGVSVEPRVVARLDEDRLTGLAALPVVINPYLPQYGERLLVAGALVPLPGEYGVVFDSPGASGAGSFTFRYWVNDTTPPSVRVRARSVVRGQPLRLSVTDAGSGVYPASFSASIGGNRVSAVFRRSDVRIATGGLAVGTHRLRVVVSDYQETRNGESIPGIRPNTRFFSTTIRIRAR